MPVLPTKAPKKRPGVCSLGGLYPIAAELKQIRRLLIYPPLNPGRPPERAGESTRTPLTSPEKLAMPRPARGASLASSLAGSFRETGGQWGPHPRAPALRASLAHCLCMWLFAAEKSNP